MEDYTKLSRSQLPNIASLIDRLVLAETMSCKRFLNWSGRTMFLRQSVSVLEQVTKSCFEVWVIGGINFGHLGLPIYAEIAFVDSFPASFQLHRVAMGDPPEAFFWKSMFESRPVDLRSATNIVRMSRFRNAVYVPAEVAHPDGWFFSALRGRPERAKALLVAFYGRVNLRLCSHCIRSYSSTVTAAREHVLFPFHECISFLGYWHGDCANCLWSGRADCSWRTFNGYQRRLSDPAKINPFLGKDCSQINAMEPRPSYLSSKVAPRVEKIRTKQLLF